MVGYEMTKFSNNWVDRNSEISGGGSKFFKKVPHMARLLLWLIRVDQ